MCTLSEINIHGGHPEYGCFISKEKTLTNFDDTTQIMNITEPGQQRELLPELYWPLHLDIKLFHGAQIFHGVVSWSTWLTSLFPLTIQDIMEIVCTSVSEPSVSSDIFLQIFKIH